MKTYHHRNVQLFRKWRVLRLIVRVRGYARREVGRGTDISARYTPRCCSAARVEDDLVGMKMCLSTVDRSINARMSLSILLRYLYAHKTCKKIDEQIWKSDCKQLTFICFARPVGTIYSNYLKCTRCDMK